MGSQNLFITMGTDPLSGEFFHSHSLKDPPLGFGSSQDPCDGGGSTEWVSRDGYGLIRVGDVDTPVSHGTKDEHGDVVARHFFGEGRRGDSSIGMS